MRIKFTHFTAQHSAAQPREVGGMISWDGVDDLCGFSAQPALKVI